MGQVEPYIFGVSYPCKNEKCGLWTQCVHSGLPTRLHEVESHSGLHHEKAVLVVGEAPGYHEDIAGKSWVGPTGQLLCRFLDSVKLSEKVDVYLTNACRCRPEQNSTPTNSKIKSCRPYLLEDMKVLSTYYSELILFVQGAVACRAVTGRILKEGFASQGAKLSELPGNPRFFATYHPAILLPGRKPHLVEAVKVHWSLLLDYLDGRWESTRQAPIKYKVALNPLEVFS